MDKEIKRALENSNTDDGLIRLQAQHSKMVKCMAKRNVTHNNLTIRSPKTGVEKTVTGRQMNMAIQRMAYRVTDKVRDTNAKESDFVEVEFSIAELIEFILRGVI